jgi:3-oxoacyl-[acyl-carrier-protein] synthase II
MTIAINGIGWLSDKGYGMVASNRTVSFAPGESWQSLPRDNFFTRPVKNFGRLDAVSRVTMAAVSLALRDGGVDSSPLQKQALGIVGTNSDGCLTTDTDYFRDYVENGRKLSRANLFIYTLPSSPLGEAAIHFGLTGPLLYTADSSGTLLMPFRMAAGFIADGSAATMLAGRCDGDQAIYLLLGNRQERSLCSLEDAERILSAEFHVATLVEQVRALCTD